MIQRIQSVFLFIVVLLAVLFPFFSLGKLDLNMSTFAISVVGSAKSGPEQLPLLGSILAWALWILPAIIVAITLYTIFQYKDRLFQVRLGKINIMLHVVLLVVAFFYIDAIKSVMSFSDFSYGPAIFFPMVSLLLIFRANRSILKDEGLVRAADRIR